jgi:hypothetical protein
MRCLIACTFLALPSVAAAGSCDALIAKAKDLKGEPLVAQYKQVLACSAAEAEVAYPTFVKSAAEVGLIVDLSVAAIDAKAYTPVWNVLETIPDYGARDEIAKGVGAHCADHPETIPFLKGAYYGLTKGRQFAQWENAFVACEDAQISAFLLDLVKAPPSSSYNEKYDSVLEAFIARERAGALDGLQAAATAAAANDGPFAGILDRMDQAITPEGFAAEPSADDKQRLAKAMVAVAQGVGPEKALIVADRLFAAGRESEAGSLLPSIYPDRVQPGGGLLYGVAAIEACDGAVIIHHATVAEPGKRWSVGPAIEGPARTAFKAKLKCAAAEPWPVVVSPEPLANAEAIEPWLADLEKQYGSKGEDVKRKAEKPLALD